jgi:hypothetical protein
MKPTVDQQILEQIPDELVRPLLALCMRTLRYNSVDTYQQLIHELDALREVCTGLDEQLLWSRLNSMIQLRLIAMLNVQQWAQERGHSAEPAGVYINRWYIDMIVDGKNKGYLVSYADDGVDEERMERKSKAVVIEATEDDSVLDG